MTARRVPGGAGIANSGTIAALTNSGTVRGGTGGGGFLGGSGGAGGREFRDDQHADQPGDNSRRPDWGPSTSVNGGPGGASIMNKGTIASLSNRGAIVGGNGGNGFFGAGLGGTGVRNAGTIGSLANSGKISGGAGGSGDTTGAVGRGGAGA